MSSPLRYTRNNNRLTINQRLFYETNGYLVFPGLIPQDVTNECHKRYIHIYLLPLQRDFFTFLNAPKVNCWELNLYENFIRKENPSYMLYIYIFFIYSNFP